jgi:hypothetical protein
MPPCAHRVTMFAAITALVMLLSVPVAAGAPATGLLGSASTPPDAASSRTCDLPLQSVSTGLPGPVADCSTVRVSGHGGAQSGVAAGSVSSPALAGRRWISSDIVGSCAGCDTPFGSGAAYRAFIQLQDPDGGDFIRVGLVHDASALINGDDASGLTLIVETGRNTDAGLETAQAVIPAAMNRIPSGRASLRLSWGDQGVEIALGGVIPPGEDTPRTLAIGTYAVTLTHPVASFGGMAKNPSDQIDATFTAITVG